MSIQSQYIGKDKPNLNRYYGLTDYCYAEQGFRTISTGLKVKTHKYRFYKDSVELVWDICSLWDWSGKYILPKIGAEVNINMNGFGKSIVVAYFLECGWVGVECRTLNQPEWHIKQCGLDKHPLIMGAELSE